MSSVTTGAVHRIKAGETIVDPVIQVIAIKQMETSNASSTGAPNSTRYRCVFTDGQECIAGMLATQLNNRIASGDFHENAIIRITKYNSQVLQNQKFLIVLEFAKVGVLPNPLMRSTIGDGGANSAQAAPAAQPPSYGQTSYGAPPVASFPPAPAPAQPSYNAYGNVPQYGAPPAAPAATPAYGQPAPSFTAAPNPYAAAAAPAPAYSNNPYGGYGSGSKPVVRSDNMQIVPISAINPYSNKWTIKARITSKSERRTWSNAKGQGTLFNIDLLDSAGGEIRATFFKESCEKWFPILEEGKVYTFSNGQVKLAGNRQFSQIKNQYELTFNQNSEIAPAGDDQDIKAQQFAFVKIDQLAFAEVSTVVDVLGIVRSASDVSEINSQKMGGKQLFKRDLTICDDTGSEVKLTLWGDKAQANYDWHLMPIVAFKGLKLGDYGGRSLSGLNSTSIMINPTIPEAFVLNEWRKQFGGNLPVANSLSSAVGGGGGADTLDKRKVISCIRDENLGSQPDKPDIISIKGSIIYIKHDNDPWYTACPTPQCNKKVTEGMNGQWYCEKCGKAYETCLRRYILNCTMADTSGSNWFTFFNETAEKILGVSADTLHSFRVDSNEAAYEKVFADALFKQYLCRVRVKQELVNDEMRTKSSGLRVDEVDLVSECHQMIEAIKKYA